MRFLADESCDFAVVQALRADGYDVLYVSEITPRAEDSEVIRLALREKRILLICVRNLGFLEGRRISRVRNRSPFGPIFVTFPSEMDFALSPM